jgi:hypothetical protein
VAEGKVLGGTVVFDMLVSYGASTNRRPNAAYVQAAVEHALGKVDFTQGRRLQLGESVAQPIKSVVVERLGPPYPENSDTFRITVEGFGPLLQRISSVIRTFDFLKSVADKLKACPGLCRTSVQNSNNVYSAVRVEGQGWVTDADGNPIPDANPSLDGTNFLYRPKIEYAQFNATVLPPTNNVGGGEPARPLDVGPTSQTIGDDEVPGWAIFLIILVFVLILTPVLCYYYARTKYGADKVWIWIRYKCSHSNPTLPFLYKPREELERIRKQLSTVDVNSSKQLSIEDDTQGVGSPGRQTAV